MDSRLVGVLGGIGSGKSEVARLLADRRDEVLDADRIAHAVLDETEVRRVLRERFELSGSPDDPIDRRELGARVFSADGEKGRRFLEEVVHPRVRKRLEEGIRRLSERDPPAQLVVIDAPLMLETGLDHLCEVLVFVDAPDERRRERVSARNGWSEAEWRKRESTQLSLDAKRERADHVVRNDASLEVLEERVRSLRTSLVTERRPGAEAE